MVAMASAGIAQAARGRTHGSGSKCGTAGSLAGRLTSDERKVRPPSSSHLAMQFAMDGLFEDPSTCSGRPAIQGKTTGKSAAESIDRLLMK
jgi:hypothetical protein